MAAKSVPADIALNLKKREMTITWLDGHESVYPLSLLRQQCPCAVCNEMRKKKEADPLLLLTPSQAGASDELEVDSPIELVGQYALQLFWADGHRTGIYTFDYLRHLG
jgi:DUF971 family protein